MSQWEIRVFAFRTFCLRIDRQFARFCDLKGFEIFLGFRFAERMASLTLSARVVGRRKPLVPDWHLDWPPDEGNRGEPLTLRQLITRIVLKEVEGFKKRQEERRLIRILSQEKIEEGLRKGRVDSGGRDLHQVVDEESAVANALQAFEDGIYLVILDGEEQRDLDREVHMHSDSHLIFLRLVMLAGA